LSTVTGSPFAGTDGSGLAIDATGKYLYADNNGNITMYAYSIDAANGVLTAVAGSPFAEGGGVGPNQLTATSNGFLYVAGVNSGVGGLGAFSINSSSGVLAAISGSPFTNVFSYQVGADPTGKFLYENDAAGKIAAYTLDASAGTPSVISGSPLSVGANAAMFCFDPQGKYLYFTANGGTAVYSFSIDASTGTPSALSTPSVAAGTSPLGCSVAKVAQ
jgi:6-phosphogluconolactonase (cycloisomerase 2 family)